MNNGREYIDKYIFNPYHTNYFRYGSDLYNNDKIIFCLNNVPIKESKEFKLILIMVRHRLFKVDKVNLKIVLLFSKFAFGYIALKFICYVHKLLYKKELEY